MVSVTGWEVATGVIVADGVKEAVESAGSPVTVNVMGMANVPFEGATVRLNMAGRPAFTDAEEVGAVTVKSLTVICNADVVPPPGADYSLVTLQRAARREGRSREGPPGEASNSHTSSEHGTYLTVRWRTR